MASGGKRGGAGERVLESRHVIGLFMLMLLFSGVFFTLGYVMGRNEYDGSVRAATDFFKKPSNSVSPKAEVNPKRANNPAPATVPTDTPAPPNSDWEFYHAGDNKKTDDHLKPVAVAAAPAKKNLTSPAKSSGLSFADRRKWRGCLVQPRLARRLTILPHRSRERRMGLRPCLSNPAPHRSIGNCGRTCRSSSPGATRSGSGSMGSGALAGPIRG